MIEIFTIFFLTVLVGVLVYFLDRKDKAHREHIDKLIKKIMAKNLTEYTNNVIMEKNKPDKKLKEVFPDIIPIEQADDKLFNKTIKKING